MGLSLWYFVFYIRLIENYFWKKVFLIVIFIEVGREKFS